MCVNTGHVTCIGFSIVTSDRKIPYFQTIYFIFTPAGFDSISDEYMYIHGTDNMFKRHKTKFQTFRIMKKAQLSSRLFQCSNSTYLVTDKAQ